MNFFQTQVDGFVHLQKDEKCEVSHWSWSFNRNAPPHPPSPNNWIIDTQRRCGRVGQWVSTQMHKQLAACSHFIFRFWTQSPDEQQFTRLSTAYPRLTPPTESMCAWTQLPWRQCGGWWDGRELSGCWDRRAGECGAKWRRGAVAVAGAASVTGRGRGGGRGGGGGGVSWSCSVVVALLP